MKNEPIILAIETALKNGSLSILKGSREIASYMADANIGRSEKLLQAINKILHGNSLALNDINLISVSTGPGSFTGVRAGIATAQALIMGLQCSYIGVSVLEVLASCAVGTDHIISVISAGRVNQYIWQSFPKTLRSEVSEPEMGTVDNLTEFIKKLNFVELSIVIESSLFRDISLVNEIVNKVDNVQLTIVHASDNVAKLVGLHAYRDLQNNRLRSSSLYPKYLLGVEIGNKRQN